MPSMIIQIKNLDAIIAKLGKLQTLKWTRQILENAAEDVRRGLARYPAPSEANTPRSWQPGGNNRWYQRQYGPRWARKDGTVGGRKTSERLGPGWATRVGDTWALIGNKASYGPYVQDKDVQASFHAQRGWATIQDEGEKAMEKALQKIGAEAERVWNE